MGSCEDPAGGEKGAGAGEGVVRIGERGEMRDSSWGCARAVYYSLGGRGEDLRTGRRRRFFCGCRDGCYGVEEEKREKKKG